MATGDRWRFRFSVDTKAFKQLGDAAAHLDKVTTSIEKVKDSINDSVKGINTTLREQVEMLRASVEALNTASGKIVIKARGMGGGGGLGGKYRVSGRLNEWTSEQFGVSDATARKYTRDEGYRGKQPAGGFLAEPMKDSKGRSYYTLPQVISNAMKLTVADPMITQLGRIREQIAIMHRDMKRLNTGGMSGKRPDKPFSVAEAMGRSAQQAAGVHSGTMGGGTPPPGGLVRRVESTVIDPVRPSAPARGFARPISGPLAYAPKEVLPALMEGFAVKTYGSERLAAFRNQFRQDPRSAILSRFGKDVDPKMREGFLAAAQRANGPDAFQQQFLIMERLSQQSAQRLKSFIEKARKTPMAQKGGDEVVGQLLYHAMYEEVEKARKAALNTHIQFGGPRGYAEAEQTWNAGLNKPLKLPEMKGTDREMQGVGVFLRNPFGTAIPQRSSKMNAGHEMDGDAEAKHYGDRSADYGTGEIPVVTGEQYKQVRKSFEKSPYGFPLDMYKDQLHGNGEKILRASEAFEKAMLWFRDQPGFQQKQVGGDLANTPFGKEIVTKIADIFGVDDARMKERIGKGSTLSIPMSSVAHMMQVFVSEHKDLTGELPRRSMSKIVQDNPAYQRSMEYANTLYDPSHTSEHLSAFVRAFRTEMLSSALNQGWIAPDAKAPGGLHTAEQFLKSDDIYKVMKEAYLSAGGHDVGDDKMKERFADGANEIAREMTRQGGLVDAIDQSIQAFHGMTEMLKQSVASLQHQVPPADGPTSIVGNVRARLSGAAGKLRDRFDAFTKSGGVDDAMREAYVPDGWRDQSFSDRARNALGRSATYAMTGGALYAGVSSITGGVRQMAEFEQQMVNIRKVINPLGADMRMISSEAKRMGEAYGVSASKVAEGMQIFAQQGQGVGDILKQTEVAVMATNVTEMSLVESTEALTAAQRQFLMSTSQSMDILDAWNEVENTTAVGARALTESLKRAGTAARAAGIDFHMFNGLAAAMGESTRKSGDAIGTAMKFILQHTRDSKSIAALQDVGIFSEDAKGNMKSVQIVLGELAAKWDKLTDAQRNNTAEAIAGTRHSNDFYTMMQTWDRAVDISISSLMSQGSAVRENDVAMQSFNKKVEQLKSSYEGLWATLGETGALDVLKQMVDMTRSLVDLLNKANSASHGMMGSIAGIGAVAGIGMGAASWMGGGLYPEMLPRFGKSIPTGELLAEGTTAQVAAAKAAGPSLSQPGAGPSSAVGANGSYLTPWWTGGRTKALGAFVGAQMVRGIYDSQFRDNTPGARPSLMDTTVDIGTTATSTAAMMKLFKTAKGGIGNKAVLAMIAAAGASQIYSAGANYIQGNNPSSPRYNSDDLTRLKALEEKYSDARSDIQGYIRDTAEGSARGDVGPDKINELKDTIAALNPGLVKFNEHGEVMVEDLNKWIADLDKNVSVIRKARTEAISGQLFNTINSSDVQKTAKDLEAALSERRQYTDKTDPNVRFANQARIEQDRQVLNSKVFSKFRANALSSGQTGASFSPLNRQQLASLSDTLKTPAQDLYVQQLTDSIHGATGVMVNVKAMMDHDKVTNVDYVQTERGGRLRDVASGQYVNTTAEEAKKAGKYVLDASPEGKFSDGVVVGPDANLKALATELNLTLEKLIAKNTDLVRVNEMMTKAAESLSFAHSPSESAATSVPVESIIRSLQTIERINTTGIRSFGLSGSNPNFGLQMKDMIAEVSAASSRGTGISTHGLIDASSKITMAMDRMNKMSQGWLDRLIANGGNVQRTRDDLEADGETQGQGEYFNQLTQAAGEKGMQQINNLAGQIEKLRRGPDADSSDVQQQIATLKQRASDILTANQNAEGESSIRTLMEQLHSQQEMQVGAASDMATKMAARFDMMRSTGQVSNIQDFMARPEVAQATDLFQKNLGEMASNVEFARQKANEFGKSLGENDQRTIRARQEVEAMEHTLASLRSVGDNLGKTFENLSVGARQSAAWLDRVGGQASMGGMYGMTGQNADAYAIEKIQGELAKLGQQLAVTKDPQEQARIGGLIGSLQVAKESYENNSKKTQDQRAAAFDGFGQRYLASRLSLAMGMPGDQAGQGIKDAIAAQMREFNERVARLVGPALSGKSSADREGLIRQITEAMNPITSKLRDLDLSGNTEYQKAYMLASPSQQAMADSIREMIRAGSTADEVFSDPMMREAAKDNPLLSSLYEGLLQNEADQQAIKFQQETASNTSEAADALKAITKLLEGLTGHPVSLDNPLTAPKPQMRSGSMALAGSAAVDGKGRIKQDGTPAVLHEGEIVLNKSQSKAFLENHYASGTMPLNAWHGSPHKFDRFNHKFMGTGQGYQTFGWGTYIAENRAVADDYRQTLTPDQTHVNVGGKIITDIDAANAYNRWVGEIFGDLLAGSKKTPDELARKYYKSIRESYRDTRMSLKKHPHIFSDPESMREFVARSQGDAIDLRALRGKVSGGKKPGTGYLYKVGFNASYDDLIHREARLADQPEKVRNFFSQFREGGIVSPHTGELTQVDDLYGNGLYDYMAELTGSPKKASHALLDHGIKGIKFYDQLSRGSQSGTNNLIAFNDSDLSILGREELSGPASRAKIDPTRKGVDKMFEDKRLWKWMAEHGIKEGTPEFLGSGVDGYAFGVGDGKVLKFTREYEEAHAALFAKGKDMYGAANIYDAISMELPQVARGRQRQAMHGIIAERLQTPVGPTQYAAADAVQGVTAYWPALNVDARSAPINGLLPQALGGLNKHYRTKAGTESVKEMIETIKSIRLQSGLVMTDAHGGNIGLKNGRPAVLDYGRALIDEDFPVADTLMNDLDHYGPASLSRADAKYLKDFSGSLASKYRKVQLGTDHPNQLRFFDLLHRSKEQNIEQLGGAMEYMVRHADRLGLSQDQMKKILKASNVKVGAEARDVEARFRWSNIGIESKGGKAHMKMRDPWHVSVSKVLAQDATHLTKNTAQLLTEESVGHMLDMVFFNKGMGPLKHPALKEAQMQTMEMLYGALASDKGSAAMAAKGYSLTHYRNNFRGMAGGRKWLATEAGQVGLSELKAKILKLAISGDAQLSPALKGFTAIAGDFIPEMASKLQDGSLTVDEYGQHLYGVHQKIQEMFRSKGIKAAEKMSYLDLIDNKRIRTSKPAAVARAVEAASPVAAEAGMFPSFRKLGRGAGDLMKRGVLGYEAYLMKTDKYIPNLFDVAEGAVKGLPRAVDALYNGTTGAIRGLPTLPGRAADMLGSGWTAYNNAAMKADMWMGGRFADLKGLGARGLDGLRQGGRSIADMIGRGHDAFLNFDAIAAYDRLGQAGMGALAQSGRYARRFGRFAMGLPGKGVDLVANGLLGAARGTVRGIGKLPGMLAQGGDGFGSLANAGIDAFGGSVDRMGGRLGRLWQETDVLGMFGRGARGLGRYAHGLTTVGLTALTFGGQRIADRLGFGDTYEHGIAPVLDSGFQVQMLHSMAMGQGMSGMNMTPRLLNWAGGKVAGLGEDLSMAGWGRTGRLVEAGSEMLGAGGRLIGASSKLLGRAALPLTIADSSLDVAGALNWTYGKVGLRDARTTREGGKTLGSLKDALWSPLSGVADYGSGALNWVRGRGFQSERLSARGVLDHGQDLMDTMARDMHGQLGIKRWIDGHILARDIATDIGLQDEVTGKLRESATRKAALDTPLLFWGKDVLAKYGSQGGGVAVAEGGDYWKDRIGQANDQVKALEQVYAQYKEAIGTADASDFQKKSMDEMADRIRAARENAAQLTRLSQTKDGYGNVADVGSFAAKLAGHQGSGDSGMTASQFAQMASQLPHDVLTQALGAGAYNAYLEMHPGDTANAEMWRKVGAAMQPDAKLSALMGGNGEFGSADDLLHKNAAAAARANKLAGKDFLAPFQAAGELASNAASFRAILGVLPNQIDAYGRLQSSLLPRIDSAKKGLGYAYDGTADVSVIDRQRAAVADAMKGLTPDYDAASKAYKQIQDEMSQADAAWARLDPNIQRSLMVSSGVNPDGGYNLLAMVGHPNGLPSFDDLVSAMSGLTDFDSKASQDTSKWLKVGDARKAAADSEQYLKDSRRLPGVVSRRIRGDDGKMVTQYAEGFIDPTRQGPDGKPLRVLTGDGSIASKEDLFRDVQAKREAFAAKQNNGIGVANTALRLARNGASAGAFGSIADMRSFIAGKDGGLAHEFDQSEWLRNTIEQLQGTKDRTPDQDIMLAASQASLNKMMADSKYSENTFDHLHKATKALQDRLEQDGKRMLAKSHATAAPAEDDDDARWVSAPRMRTGSLSQANTAAVDGAGRIRADGTPAILHEGEIVLNRRQADAFMRNHFEVGTLPRSFDGLSMDAASFRSGTASGGGTMTHAGTITVNAGDDFMSILNKIVSMLQHNAGGQGGSQIRLGDAIPMPYERNG